ncbi:CYTH domain-containing protein [Halomonas sp. LBP4]|uniref:CYTH domain-containing protein n=1 Tax=Halomonas sp. LBP4 TaxID=2044917 RepID=UPI000D7540FA|nr:CYTH domain-containing protein [Halomonas sp. LBP4]PXX98276.1 adenylate cyclase [Halomonas sp. LBP4]
MSHEIELKLALGPQGPEALRRHPRLAGLAPRLATLGNTYFDTPEGALATARMALRLRRADGRLLQTLKTRGQGGGGLSRRGEWEWEVPGPGLDLAGLAALPPMAGHGDALLARLVPRFATDFRRETWRLELGEARIELALDLGEIRAADRTVAIRELELELEAGEPEALWDLAEALAESVPLRPADTSKAARGGALLAGTWTLPEGGGADAWLHRAVVALDALADTGEPRWREQARDAFLHLADPAGSLHAAARELAQGLDDPAWPTPAFGLAALRLARRLPGDGQLS